MPNWCNNQIIITGQQDELNNLLNQAKNEEQVFALKKIVPLDVQNIDTQSAAWGTKWDLSMPEIQIISPNQIQLNCETAWGPPDKAFETISQKYPNLHFKMFFWESGADFMGEYILKNGQYLSNKTTSYSQQTHNEMKISFDEIIIQNDQINIPIKVTRKQDAFDFESKDISVNWNVSISIEEVLKSFEIDTFTKLKFTSENDNELEKILTDKEFEIIDYFEENWFLLQKVVQAHCLNDELNKKQKKKFNYKI